MWRQHALSVATAALSLLAALWSALPAGTQYPPSHPALEMGTPGSQPQISQQGYVVGYDNRTRQPAWVCEKLTADSLKGRTERTDDFRSDPRVPPEFRATLEDYAGSGFDRGHQAPAGDHKRDAEAMSSTFWLSNMSPQSPALNRQTWRLLEEHVREIVNLYGGELAYVVTGPLWADATLAPQGAATEGFRVGTIGPNHVWVPTHSFKAVLYWRDGKWHASAWILPQAPDKTFDHYRTSVDKIEHLAGLDLFSELPDDEERRLEQ